MKTHWHHIGKAIQNMRNQQGMTQRELAEKIGTNYQDISNIENGRNKCSVDKLVKIAEALDCYLDINLTKT